MENDNKTLTVHIPTDLHKSVKVLCARNGEKIRDFVIEAIRTHVVVRQSNKDDLK